MGSNLTRIATPTLCAGQTGVGPSSMLKRLLFTFLGLMSAPTIHAVCPEKPLPLCEIVKMNAFVAHARVAATQHLVDEDDPQGLAGWLYHLDVVRDYRGGKAIKRSAYSVNTTARLELKTGKEYIVFAGPDAEGNLETGNYCAPYTEMEYTVELENQVKACVVGEKKASKPNKKFQRAPAAPLN